MVQDPLYSAPSSGNPESGERVVERTFVIRNELEEHGVYAVSLTKSRATSRLIKAEIPGLESLRKIPLKPGQEKEVRVRFVILPRAKIGEKMHFPIEIRRLRPKPAVIGGVTFTIEVATGRLEGLVATQRKTPGTKGIVTIVNTKHREQEYSTDISSRGTFSFKDITPGPYHITAKCEEGIAKGSVFVEPNTVTKKFLLLKSRRKPVGGILKNEAGNPLVETLVAVRDPETNVNHLVRTDARGVYSIPDVNPGEYEITMLEKEGIGPKTVKLDKLSLEEE